LGVKGYVTISFGPCPSTNGDGKLNKLLGGYSIIMLMIPYEKKSFRSTLFGQFSP
jgi:hypothetical protein